MKNVKFAVIYYSSTGTNYQLAQWAVAAAQDFGVKEVKLRKVEEKAPSQAIEQNKDWKEHLDATREITTVTLDDLEWADAILFCAPTRYGDLPSQLSAFFDTTGGLWSQGKLANKVVSGMTSAQNPHGGQESTLLSLYKSMYHWGAIIVSPGYTDESLFGAGGNPYGVSVSAGKENLNDSVHKAVRHQVKRLLTVSGWLTSGKAQQ